jgi:hypothetical protein
MRLNLNRKVAIGAVLLAACAATGGAYAASTDNGATSRQAFLDDAAKRLGVPPQRLKDAFAGALQDKLNAAVKAGKLTQAQANAMVQRFQHDGGLGLEPLPFGGGFHGHRFGMRGGPLGGAAGYLGLTVPQLLSQLESGKSLAQIAHSRGKSTSGLENAIVSDERTRLEKERASGEITATQEQQMLSGIQAHVKELVNHTGGLHGFGHRLPAPPDGPPPGGPGQEPGAVGPAPPAPPAA